MLEDAGGLLGKSCLFFLTCAFGAHGNGLPGDVDVPQEKHSTPECPKLRLTVLENSRARL